MYTAYCVSAKGCTKCTEDLIPKLSFFWGASPRTRHSLILHASHAWCRLWEWAHLWICRQESFPQELWIFSLARKNCPRMLGNGPSTVSESTVPNTELSEFFAPHRVPGRELSELLWYIGVPERAHRVFRRTHRVCSKTQWGSVSSLLRNSTLETVFRYRFLDAVSIGRFHDTKF